MINEKFWLWLANYNMKECMNKMFFKKRKKCGNCKYWESFLDTPDLSDEVMDNMELGYAKQYGLCDNSKRLKGSIERIEVHRSMKGCKFYEEDR